MKPSDHSWVFNTFCRPNRLFWWLAGLILLLAAALRLAALFSLRSTIYFDYLILDERLYHETAVKIANGTWKTSSVYEFAPLYAYVMAGVYKLFSPDVVYVRYLNLIFGVLTCLGIGLVGRQIGGRRSGLAAMLVAALYKPLILYSVVPLKTALSAALFTWFIWSFLSGLNRSSGIRHWFSAGLAGGLMINVRPNFLVVLPVVVVFFLVVGFRDGLKPKRVLTSILLLLAGFGLCIFPFMLRNYRVAGEVALTASQGGFNFYAGNNLENELPYYRPVRFASSSPFFQGPQFNIEASRRAGRVLSPRESSAFWTRETLAQAWDSPRAFATKIGLKILAFCNRFEAGDHYDIDFIGQFARFFRLPMFDFDVILALAMAGLVAGLAGNRKILAGGIVFTVYGLTLIAFFCNSRYRLPLVSILIPLAVYAAHEFVHSMRAKKRARAGGMVLVAGLAMCVSWLPVTGTDDMTGYYNIHGLILSRQGRIEEAVPFWQTASKMNRSYSACADLALAGVYYQRGDREKALIHLDKIPDHSFAAADKYAFLGDLAVKGNNFQKAAAHYGRSLQINAGRQDVRKKYIRVLETTDPRAAARQKTDWLKIQSFYQ